MERPTAAEPRILELQGVGIAVRAGSGWRPVVDTVSLAVRAAERIGLVGESGSGKSLTALAILGLLPDGVRADQGRLLLDGVSVLDADERELRRLRGRVAALVLQEAAAALNPTFSAGFQLIETLRHHHGGTRRAAKADALDALEALGLDDPEAILAAFPHQLSGGQAQRVNLALALAGRPRLLIADEPVTALDVTTQAQVLRLISTVCHERQMALLLISHDLAVVGSMVDRIAVMLAGELVEIGPAERLLTRPLHPYTRLLLEASGRTPETAPARPVPAAARPEDPVTGCRHAWRCPLREPACVSRHPTLEPAERPTASHGSPIDAHLVRCPVTCRAPGPSATGLPVRGITHPAARGDAS